MKEEAVVGKVFSPGVAEDVALESMGYRPELKRSFGLLGMIGFSFSIVTRQVFCVCCASFWIPTPVIGTDAATVDPDEKEEKNVARWDA
ncbi:hypothetical protein DSL72_001473 [Monilinia vaccinii-corymbosi]|uniref:Uncharacterized protein n=1 Tax=Monilinia vaccinii-corymbosi TaxID=61207 RepID=A0A8A3P607_9HELO|nr:hypothetical protein DSL72_001473 [Monilinia vaccinii-corymbosi]